MRPTACHHGSSDQKGSCRPDRPPPVANPSGGVCRGSNDCCPGRAATVRSEEIGFSRTDLRWCPKAQAAPSRGARGGGLASPQPRYDRPMCWPLSRFRRDRRGCRERCRNPEIPATHTRPARSTPRYGLSTARSCPEGGGQLCRGVIQPDRPRATASQPRASQVGCEVGSRCVVGRVERRGGFAAAPGAVGAPFVDQRTAGHGQQPGPRPLRYPLARPLQRRREQRLLHGVLAGIKLPVPPDQRGEDLRRALPQEVLDPVLTGHRPGPCAPGHGCAEWSMIRRTSIGYSV
jgi:hypothetical protein